MQNHTDPDGVGADDAPEPEPAPTSGAAPAGPGRAEAEPAEPTEPSGPEATDAAGPQTPGYGTPGAESTSPGATGPQTGGSPAPPPGGARASAGDGFFGALRRIGVVRTDDRWIGGVCSGLAHRFGLDPLLVRGIVAATVLVGGFGIVCYGLAWALLPEARDGRIHLQETVAGRFDSAVLGALGMVLLGLVRGDGWLWWGRAPEIVQGLAWLAFLAVVVTVVVVAAKSASDRKNPPSAAPPFSVPPNSAPPRPTYPTASRPMTDHPPAYPAPPTPPAPTAYAPQWTPPPVPVAVRQRRPGPGRTAVGVVVALTLIATAGLLLASRSGHLDAPTALVAAGVCVVLTGLGIVVSGLRGRRSGVLGFLAIVTVLFAGPWAVYEAGDWPHHRGESTVTLTDVDIARAGIDQGVGNLVVDLRTIDLTGVTAREPDPEPSVAPEATAEAGTDEVPEVPEPSEAPEPPAVPQTVWVPVRVGAGDVRLLLPEGVRTRVEVEVGAGRVEWQIDEQQTLHGFGLQRTFRTDRDADGPELVVHVSIGVGDLTVSHDDAQKTVSQKGDRR